MKDPWLETESFLAKWPSQYRFLKLIEKVCIPTQNETFKSSMICPGPIRLSNYAVQTIQATIPDQFDTLS